MSDEKLRQNNIALVRRFIDAINDSWNVKTLGELISDDFVFSFPFAPDWFRSRYEGRQAALAFADSVHGLIDQENLQDLRAHTFADDPGEVIVTYRGDSRSKATNLPYRNEYVGRATVRDGKITRFAEYLDAIRFAVALGGRVEPPAPVGSILAE